MKIDNQHHTVVCLHEFCCDDPNNTFESIVDMCNGNVNFIIPHAPKRRNPKIHGDHMHRHSWFNYLTNNNSTYDTVNRDHLNSSVNCITKLITDIGSNAGLLSYSQGGSLAIEVTKKLEEQGKVLEFVHISRSIPLQKTYHTFQTPIFVTLGEKDDVFPLEFAKQTYRDMNVKLNVVPVNHTDSSVEENEFIKDLIYKSFRISSI